MEAFHKIGVSEVFIPDADLNVFQPHRYDLNERGLMEGTLGGSKIAMGSFVEFYAEMDMFLCVSNCPVGAQDRPHLESKNTPFQVEIYDTGVQPAIDYSKLNWAEWREKFFRELLEKKN